MVSPFVDPRWAATNSLHILETKGSKVSVVRDGATGQLGDVHFRVIGPAVTDSQIEDSNDGSLVMFWQFGQFNLVTMADAGERSQQNIANRSIDWLERVAKQLPLVLKVSHHGSADQFAEFIEALDPDVSLVSVGVDNAYGHPTQRTLQLLELAGSKILRTDLEGSIAIEFEGSGIHFSTTGRG